MRTLLTAMLAVLSLCAQPPQRGGGGPSREAVQLDLEGKTTEARALLEKIIESVGTPQMKAQAERSMAMSYAFDGNCQKTAEYERKVIDYWKTREQDEPGNAFYQEGEMANEAARVCIDYGDLDTAASLYKLGHDLGLKEPNISAGRKDLWEFRLLHAQARIAARRGQKAEAQKKVAEAQAVLDRLKTDDQSLYNQQIAFFPYLTGYVAYYAGDYKKALEDFQKDTRNDPFIACMIGMTYEKLGDKDKAMDAYRKAAAATGHNPPAAFAKPFARKKLEGK